MARTINLPEGTFNSTDSFVGNDGEKTTKFDAIDILESGEEHITNKLEQYNVPVKGPDGRFIDSALTDLVTVSTMLNIVGPFTLVGDGTSMQIQTATTTDLSSFSIGERLIIEDPEQTEIYSSRINALGGGVITLRAPFTEDQIAAFTGVHLSLSKIVSQGIQIDGELDITGGVGEVSNQNSQSDVDTITFWYGTQDQLDEITRQHGVVYFVEIEES